MKTKIRLWIPAILATLFSLFLTNCTNDVTIPILTTNEITDVTETTATSGGSISSDGGANITERGICWSTNQNPTIADFKTINGTESSTFTSTITGLTANRTYYLRAYATNRKGTGYGNSISFTTLGAIFNPNITYGTVTDIDGNTYKTVTIGTQTWMAENLKVTKYNDGIAIPNVTDNTAWGELTTGALCDYGNTPSNSETYGKLYNWYAVNTGKLAPKGWHVASDAEWTELTDYLGGTSVAGGKLKETGTTHWYYPNTGATNETGFTALPGGVRSFNGTFYFIGSNGFWWSATATEGSTFFAEIRYMDCDYSYVYRDYYSKGLGFSVRCVRD